MILSLYIKDIRELDFIIDKNGNLLIKLILFACSNYSIVPRNILNYFFSIVKKYESSSHIIVPVLAEPVIIAISPKDSPGMNVLSFRIGASILSVGK